MHILEKTDIDWCERRLISKLSMDQSVKVDWTKTRQQVRRLEEGLDIDAVCHRFYSTYTVNMSPTKLLKGLQTSR